MKYVDSPFQSPAILSLCSGLRLLDRGIESVIGPIRTVAYVEIEAFCIENMVQAMEAGAVAPAPVWSNLKTFDAKPFRGKIHGIIGGYPCQPFSLSGSRQGVNDPRHLYPFIEKIIRETGPAWCFFENVPGHLSMGFDTVLRSLQNLGYSVEAGIFSAEEVGATQRRQRLFILALANSYRQWEQQLQRGFEESRGWTEYIGEEMVSPNHAPPTQTKISSRRTTACISGESLDNSDFGNCEKLRTYRIPINQKKANAFRCANNTIFPSPPGLDQFAWEEPRITQPGLGCTIDGYNFREDILRGLGNGVVPQTAAKAFYYLLRKHFTNVNN